MEEEKDDVLEYSHSTESLQTPQSYIYSTPLRPRRRDLKLEEKTAQKEERMMKTHSPKLSYPEKERKDVFIEMVSITLSPPQYRPSPATAA